jgi:hypothetical protein
MATRQTGTTRELSRRDVEHELRATLAARRELGADPDTDDALVRSFMGKLDWELDRRVEAAIAARERALAKRGRGFWSYALAGTVAAVSFPSAVVASMAAAHNSPYSVYSIPVIWLVTLLVNLLAILRR